MLDFADFLTGIKDLKLVIDHMAHLHFEDGLDQPQAKWIIERLKNDENWWMLCSNGNRDSRMERDYLDAVPFGHAFIAAAPDRMVWGSDWPHTWYMEAANKGTGAIVPGFADLIAPVVRALPDEKIRQTIFSDAPAMLCA